MNIWIINHNAIPPKYGALVRHYYFAKYMISQGDKVTIFTSSKIHNTDLNLYKKGERYYIEKIDGIDYAYIKNANYNGNGIDRIYNMLQFAWKVGKIDKKFEKPDLIYTSSPDIFPAFTTLKMARRLKLPFILEIRDLWPESIVEVNHISRKNFVIKILYAMEKKLYQKADQLIFTIPGGGKYIKNRGWEKKVDLNKIAYVNNGVDVEEFLYNLETYKLENNILLSKKFKVIYCGSIRKANGLRNLIDAARIIKKRKIEDIEFLIFGDGSEKRELEEISHKENLPVYFEGRVDKKYVPYILNCADLNILNYMDVKLLEMYGSSSNKLFEYIASGKPILSNRLLMNDMIAENNLGTAKNFSSAEEYADAILKYYYMPVDEKERIRESAKKVIKEYDYKKLSKKVWKIIHDLNG